jgi:hypothetical protein
MNRYIYIKFFLYRLNHLVFSSKYPTLTLKTQGEMIKIRPFLKYR